MHGTLRDVAQSRDADGLDARALQVVEQRQIQLPLAAETGRPRQVGVEQVGRGALQGPLLVGVDAAFGQFDVGVHVGTVDTQTQIPDQRLAQLDLHARGHTLVGVAERVDGGASGEHLHTLDRLVEVLVVTRHRDHVAAAVEQFVAQVEVVVVAVLQCLVTAQLDRTVGLLVEERSHLDERRPRDRARGGQAQLLFVREAVADVQRREEVVLVEVAPLADTLVVVVAHPLLRGLVAHAGVDEQQRRRLQIEREVPGIDAVAGLIAVLGLLLAVDRQRAVGDVPEAEEIGIERIVDLGREFRQVIVEARAGVVAALVLPREAGRELVSRAERVVDGRMGIPLILVERAEIAHRLLLVELEEAQRAVLPAQVHDLPAGSSDEVADHEPLQRSSHRSPKAWRPLSWCVMSL